MWFFTNYYNVVFSCSCVQFEEFLSAVVVKIKWPISGYFLTYMKLMPTIPRPTTTILLRFPTAIVDNVWSTQKECR